mmetsp:Transcript_50026/g.130310  ORF Transcript_50026/g.130310 Transcript_50026/m.130310 type:complete len:302 (-) Transcript_50026:1661-2566(-)
MRIARAPRPPNSADAPHSATHRPCATRGSRPRNLLSGTQRAKAACRASGRTSTKCCGCGGQSAEPAANTAGRSCSAECWHSSERRRSCRRESGWPAGRSEAIPHRRALAERPAAATHARWLAKRRRAHPHTRRLAKGRRLRPKCRWRSKSGRCSKGRGPRGSTPKDPRCGWWSRPERRRWSAERCRRCPEGRGRGCSSKRTRCCGSEGTPRGCTSAACRGGCGSEAREIHRPGCRSLCAKCRWCSAKGCRGSCSAEGCGCSAKGRIAAHAPCSHRSRGRTETESRTESREVCCSGLLSECT